MRVLHFIESLRLGGKERQVVELLKGLSKFTNIESFLVCMEEEDFYLPEIKQIAVPMKFLIRKTRWDPLIFLKLLGLVKEFKPDIIHTNSLMNSFYAFPICKCLRIKLINGSIRNALNQGGIRWKLEKFFLRCADFRIANSKAGLKSRGFSINSGNNFVIYNGFDFSRLIAVPDTNKTKNSLGIKGQKVVGMVAEFSHYKDYETFIEAAKMILHKRNDVIFLAIGDGDNLDTCKKMVDERRDGIRFLGSRKDVEAIVSVFDIGVLSTYTEGISNSIMEYMVLGKPVIVTDGGGSNEIVSDGKSGFLIPPKNPQLMAEKIQFLINNQSIAKKMGEAGRILLKRNFTLEKMVKNTIQLYELALK